MLARCTSTHPRSFASCTSAGAFGAAFFAKFGLVSTSKPTKRASPGVAAGAKPRDRSARSALSTSYATSTGGSANGSTPGRDEASALRSRAAAARARFAAPAGTRMGATRRDASARSAATRARRARRRLVLGCSNNGRAARSQAPTVDVARGVTPRRRNSASFWMGACFQT